MKYEGTQLTPEDVNEQIKGIISEKYVAPDYLHLFQEVFEAQYQVERRLHAEDICPSITQEEARRRLGQGLPAIDISTLQLNEAELAELFDRICSILVKQGNNQNPIMEQLRSAVKSSEIRLGDLILAFGTADEERLKEFSERLGGNREELTFVAQALVAPFLRVCARLMKGKLDLEQLLTDKCPVCGGTPLMAKLRGEDGKRILECSLCNTQWAFPRLKCPCCGNTDPDTLGFFFVEESAYRVDKCDKCKGYIKTLDERKRPEGGLRALAVEDAATLYLDILAAREGYRSVKECEN